MNHLNHCLRAMAWERAKGELRAILATYSETLDGPTTGDNYEEARKVFESFITHVEDHGVGGIT